MDTDLHYQQGGLLSARNARSLYQAARTLAGTERYGLACSLLVLSAEESIKAIDRAALSIGLDWDPNADKRDKTKHGYRHQIARALIAVASYTRAMGVTEIPVGGYSRLLADLAKRFMGDINCRSLPDEVSELWSWWDRANALKMQGFYVDESGDAWKSPESVSRIVYENAVRHIKPILFGAAIVRRCTTKGLPSELTGLLEVDMDGLASTVRDALQALGN